MPTLPPPTTPPYRSESRSSTLQGNVQGNAPVRSESRSSTLRGVAAETEANSSSMSFFPRRSKSKPDSSGSPPESKSESGSRATSKTAERRRTRSKTDEASAISRGDDLEDDLHVAKIPSMSSFGPRPSAPSAKQTQEGLGETGFGARSLGEMISPTLSDNFRLVRGKSEASGTKSLRSMMMSSKSESEIDPFDPTRPDPGYFDLNRSGVIPTAIFAGVWTTAASIVLFAMVYIYRFQEVLKSYQVAEEAALAHAQLQAADLLLPAIAAVDSIRAAMSGGVLRDLSEYDTIHRLLQPHFRGRGILEEIELAAPPTETPGSVLLKRISPDGDIAVLTDREDCHLVAGMRGCSAAALSAATGDWYKDGFGIDKPWSYVPPDQFWRGPLFIRDRKDLAVCPTLCWKPAYMFVKRARAGGGPQTVITYHDGIPEPAEEPASNATTDLTEVLVRVVMSSAIFQDLVASAAALSRGEAILATSNGDVIASADMASAVKIDMDTGNLVVGKVQEASTNWARDISEELVSNGAKGRYAESGAYTLTVRRVEGPNGDPLNLGETMRLVMGTPIFAFMDGTLFTLTWPSCGVSAAPAVALAFAVIFACFRRRRKKQQASRISESAGSGSGSAERSTSRQSMALSSIRQSTARNKFAATGRNRTHLENRRTSLTEAVGLKDVRKRLTRRQKTIELTGNDEPAEAPQDQTQLAEAM